MENEQKINHFINIDPKWILLFKDGFKFCNPYLSDNYVDNVIDFYSSDLGMAKKMNGAKLKGNVNDFGKLLLYCVTGTPIGHYADCNALENDIRK